ncbi:aldo/keto reductase [Undibacterium sp.]|jgi:2,5-diketo-D-gluconate reductase B|uniref:aldo/keto reductase n=1 Tax=Undibacterium sp. TaxID=1914977 RepID=UPI002BF1F34B|nr:aldo/keto reductase [Undibacterium sp.]HTD06303.1 aldo/keto reductase [Undibacterium sp.]
MDAIQTQGIDLPRLGLGTFRMQGDACRAAVESALDLGYRHIDTAAMYDNEDAVGAAIASSAIAREDLHVTTKVWHDRLAPEAIIESLESSLHKLQLDYVDLYLVHWPSRDMNLRAIFDTLARLKEQGRIRAMGVSNFTVGLLRAAIEETGAPIACNQVEYHVLLDQTPLRSYLAGKGIPLVAYCPLAQGKLADHPELAAIAARHGATPAQIALKWLLEQDGVAAIPKAQKPESQKANLDALKLQLDDEDRRIIARLPKNMRLANPPFAPLWD